MIVVKTLADKHQICDTAIRALVQQRINDLGREAFDAESLGYFLVVEARDNMEAINAQIGFNILQNRATGIQYSDTGFTPSFEFVEEFPDCFDMVFVIDDSGFGVELFIPKMEGVALDLLTMCQQHAFKTDPPNQATIYVTAQVMATVGALVGLDECDRDQLNSKPETALNQQEGYYLATESMRLAVLPVDAEVVRLLSPSSMDTYQRHVSFPPELRGVVFSGAPQLPSNYAVILGHWSPLEGSVNREGAQHCQNLLNTVEMPDYPLGVVLSNGVVACIQGVRALVAGLSPHQYIEIQIPVDPEMLGMDREKFDSAEPYDVSPDLPVQRIFLKVQDILASPDPDFVAIAVCHTENWDADFNM